MEIILYAGSGFAAALLLVFIFKILFSNNVQTINMSSKLKPGSEKGKEMRTQILNMVESGNKRDALEALKNSGKLSSEQSEKVMEMLGKLSSSNTFGKGSSNELIEKVKKLMRENKKIEAIKLIKETGNISLKDAKEITDKIESGSSGI